MGPRTDRATNAHSFRIVHRLEAGSRALGCEPLSCERQPISCGISDGRAAQQSLAQGGWDRSGRKPATERAYLCRIHRCIGDNGRWHPRDMGGVEEVRLLSGLAQRDWVAPRTQNQALSVLPFLHRQMLTLDLP